MYLSLTSHLYADNVETLLNNYKAKNDLSQKTIDENKGHLVLFTREKLEKMHAKTLKDVFKTTPAIYYHENRYALPDPLSGGTFELYKSNFIRLYVDGVEITQGWIGSGLVLYGDMNIDFVDHIEFYYAVPSFETSVEPAYLTIFVYSKNPKYDAGGKVSLIQGSRGHSTQSASYGEQKEDYAYMVNVSHTNAKREKVDNGTSRPLLKDFERTQIFSYIKSENQVAHLQVMHKNMHSLAGFSADATPLKSKMDYLNLHLDYGIDFDEHWRAQFAYDWLKTNLYDKDDAPLVLSYVLPTSSLDATLKNSTYSAELSYKNTLDKHRMHMGIKGRWKKLDSLEFEGLGKLVLDFDYENIFSIFLQDQYALSKNQLLSLGIEYSKINRNPSVENDTLLHLRLGYIYTSEYWSYKAYLYRTMFTLEPLVRQLSGESIMSVNPQVTKGITQELSYLDDNYRLRLILLLMKDQNGLIESDGEGNTRYFFSILNYDYNFDVDTKLSLQLYYAKYKNLIYVDSLKDTSGYMSFSNRYKNFEFYNGVVWHQNSLNHTNYFDVTSSISWEVNENLTFTLKGENILDKAKKTSLFRISPTTGQLLQPLEVSPIDRRFTIEMEYTF
jgi:iron complex outermembrane receptor protein